MLEYLQSHPQESRFAEVRLMLLKFYWSHLQISNYNQYENYREIGKSISYPHNPLPNYIQFKIEFLQFFTLLRSTLQLQPLEVAPK